MFCVISEWLCMCVYIQDSMWVFICTGVLLLVYVKQPYRFRIKAVLTWESLIPLTLQAGVDWGTSEPPLSHISWIKNVCGGANAGMLPRLNILGYHCAVYQRAQSENIYTSLLLHKRERDRAVHSPFCIFTLYLDSIVKKERENMWEAIAGCDLRNTWLHHPNISKIVSHISPHWVLVFTVQTVWVLRQ